MSFIPSKPKKRMLKFEREWRVVRTDDISEPKRIGVNIASNGNVTSSIMPIRMRDIPPILNA